MAYIKDIDDTTPAGTDLVSQGDNEIRQLKTDVFQSFPNVDGEVGFTPAQANAVTTYGGAFTYNYNGSSAFQVRMNQTVYDNIPAALATLTPDSGSTGWNLTANADCIVDVSFSWDGTAVASSPRNIRTYISRNFNAGFAPAQTDLIATSHVRTAVDSSAVGMAVSASLEMSDTDYIRLLIDDVTADIASITRMYATVYVRGR